MRSARPDTWILCKGKMFFVEDLPTKPGVYVIKFNNEVVYIGQSNNLRSRITRHQIRYGYARNIITPWGDVSDTTRVTCKYRVSRRLGDWAMWEIRLIDRLQPRFNKTYTGVRWKGAA